AAAVADRAGQVPAERRAFLLETLAHSSLPKLPPSWTDAIGQALRQPVPAVRLQAVRTAAGLQVARFDEQLVKLAEDRAEPPELRMEAVRGVVPRRPRLSPTAFDLLMAQLNDKDNPLARLAAAEVLGHATLSDAQVERLLRAVRGDALVSPAVLLPALRRS